MKKKKKVMFCYVKKKKETNSEMTYPQRLSGDVLHKSMQRQSQYWCVLPPFPYVTVRFLIRKILYDRDGDHLPLKVGSPV